MIEPVKKQIGFLSESRNFGDFVSRILMTSLIMLRGIGIIIPEFGFNTLS